MTSHDEHYVICLFSGRKEDRNKEIDGNRAYVTLRYVTLRYVTYVTQGCYHTINGYIPFPNQCRTYKTSSALQPEG